MRRLYIICQECESRKKNDRSLFRLTEFPGCPNFDFITAVPEVIPAKKMKILVCLKQVPEPDTTITLNAAGTGLQIQGHAAYSMNRFDEFALEEAVRIKEMLEDVAIDVVTVGPKRSEQAIRRALGMGAEQGVHILTEDDGWLSPALIAAWIAGYARNRSYDLIFAGIMSEDAMQGQVGPMLAAQLAWPWATAVVYEKIAKDKKSIYVEREIEAAGRATLELRLPAVLTIQSGINAPRYPSLSNLLRANKQELTVIEAAKMPQRRPRETIVRMTYPHKMRAGKILSGTPREKAARLLTILQQKGFVF